MRDSLSDHPCPYAVHPAEDVDYPLIECFIYNLHRFLYIIYIYVSILKNFAILQSLCRVGWIFSGATFAMFIARKVFTYSHCHRVIQAHCHIVHQYLSFGFKGQIDGRISQHVKAFWSCNKYHNSVTQCPGPHITRNQSQQALHTRTVSPCMTLFCSFFFCKLSKK